MKNNHFLTWIYFDKAHSFLKMFPLQSIMFSSYCCLCPVFFQLYCGHFHLLLSDKGQFPHLYQISPKDTSLPLAMVSLMVHFRWNWIGAMITNDDYGIQFLSEFRGEMQKTKTKTQKTHKTPKKQKNKAKPKTNKQ